MLQYWASEENILIIINRVRYKWFPGLACLHIDGEKKGKNEEWVTRRTRIRGYLNARILLPRPRGLRHMRVAHGRAGRTVEESGLAVLMVR